MNIGIISVATKAAPMALSNALCDLVASIQSLFSMLGMFGIVCSAVFIPAGIALALYGHFRKKSRKITLIGVILAVSIPLITIISVVIFLLAPLIIGSLTGGNVSNC